jgi:NADH:ubiquinone oxidoreductase subunit 3 (subunit A)
MSAVEVTTMILSVTQPLCVGLFAYVGLARALARSGFGSTLSSRRERLAAFRFYECATYSRLASAFVYPLSFTMVLCAYVIYDVDLALFLCEVLLLADAGLVELFAFSMLTGFTVVGLVYDYRASGYSWELR